MATKTRWFNVGCSQHLSVLNCPLNASWVLVLVSHLMIPTLSQVNQHQERGIKAMVPAKMTTIQSIRDQTAHKPLAGSGGPNAVDDDNMDDSNTFFSGLFG